MIPRFVPPEAELLRWAGGDLDCKTGLFAICYGCNTASDDAAVLHRCRLSNDIIGMRHDGRGYCALRDDAQVPLYK
jgi:hypothetical protein